MERISNFRCGTFSRSQYYYTTFFKKIKRQKLLNIYKWTTCKLCNMNKYGGEEHGRNPYAKGKALVSVADSV
jgi:hypothetical protein